MTRASGGEAVRPGAVEFTGRQREVLRLLSVGKTNPEIGEALGISLDGAKWHVSEILGKLDVSTREEAAEWWLAHSRLHSRFTRALKALVPGSVWLKVGAGVAVAAGVLVAVTFGVIALRNSPGPPVMLTLNLQPGVSYTLQSAVHSVGDETTDGKTQHADSTMTTTSTMTVDTIDADGTVHVSVAFVAIKLEMYPGSSTPTVWDTGAPPSPAEAGIPGVRAWRALIGQSYRATLRPDGSVTASDVDDLLTSVVDQLGISSDLAASNLEVLKSQLGDQSIDNGLQQGLPALPARSIRDGDTWKEERTPGAPISLHSVTTYTLKDQTATEASVVARGSVATDPSQWVDIMLDTGPAKISADRKGERTGELKIDLATGLVTSGHVTEKAAGTSTGLLNGQTYTSTDSFSTEITFSWRK